MHIVIHPLLPHDTAVPDVGKKRLAQNSQKLQNRCFFKGKEYFNKTDQQAVQAEGLLSSSNYVYAKQAGGQTMMFVCVAIKEIGF